MEILSPARIMEVGLGFWPAKVLLSAIELGVFTELGANSMTGRELQVVEVSGLVQVVPPLRHADVAVHPAALGPQTPRDRSLGGRPEGDRGVFGQPDRSRLG